MSRIGKMPIEIPQSVSINIDDRQIKVTGPKGELELKLLPGFKLEQKEQRLELTIIQESAQTQMQYGLMRTLIANMIIGVSTGFEKKLEVNGVGFKVNLNGQTLVLNLGFSHPIEYTAPEGIDLKVEQNTITVSGYDKQVVGAVAAKIRSYKKPEPYKGKGIKYIDEVIRRKAGKAAVKAGA